MKMNRKIWIVACLLGAVSLGFTACGGGDDDDDNPKVENPDNNNGSGGNTQTGDNGNEGAAFVDLGLSVKWASCNIGANNPEETGNYYAWGETTKKQSYTEDNWQYKGDFPELGIKEIIGTDYDVAYKTLGKGWRLPLKSEFQEMVDKCTITITTKNSVKVVKVTGPNGNTIYLPMGGYYKNRTNEDKGISAYYWSGTLEARYAQCFYATNGKISGSYWLHYTYGALVRAVHE